jgi:hypothetical protein
VKEIHLPGLHAVLLQVATAASSGLAARRPPGSGR